MVVNLPEADKVQDATRLGQPSSSGRPRPAPPCYDRMQRKTVAVLAAASFIAALTLVPVGGGAPEQLSSCLICGARGTADAVLNVILFIPLGAALAARWGAPAAVLGALAMPLG